MTQQTNTTNQSEYSGISNTRKSDLVYGYAKDLCAKYSASALLEIADAMERDAQSLWQYVLSLDGAVTSIKERQAIARERHYFADGAYMLRTIAEHAHKPK